MRTRHAKASLRRCGHRIITLLTILSLLSVSSTGCSKHFAHDEFTGNTRTIAIVPARFEPEIMFGLITVVRSERTQRVGEGAAKGAVAGALVPVELALEVVFLAANPMLLVVSIVFLPAIIVGGVIVGVTAGALAPDSPQMKARIAEMKALNDDASASLRASKAQQSLGEKVFAATAGLSSDQLRFLPGGGPADSDIQESFYDELKSSGIDLVIEVRIKRMGMLIDLYKGRALFADGRVRVLRPDNWRTDFDTEHRYIGPFRPADFWVKEGSIAREVDVAVSSLAGTATESVFLGRDDRSQELSLDGRHCVMKPFSPAFTDAPLDGNAPAQFISADPLAPRLVWEAFPRYWGGRAESKDLAAKVSEVTYDLRVWRREADGGPGELIYERTRFAGVAGTRDMVKRQNYIDYEGKEQVLSQSIPGISTAEHTLERKLDPNNRYLWSVRARYRFDGRERVTAWSRYRLPEVHKDGCEPETIVPSFYYELFMSKESAEVRQ